MALGNLKSCCGYLARHCPENTSSERLGHTNAECFSIERRGKKYEVAEGTGLRSMHLFLLDSCCRESLCRVGRRDALT